VVAATGDDRANLVFAMLAKSEFGVERVVARTNDPANQWLFSQEWGVDVAVSTPATLAAIVDRLVPDLAPDLTSRRGPVQHVSEAGGEMVDRSSGD
jgi:trk system potassium uptake protein TrkA